MSRTLFFWIYCCLQLSLIFADDIDADYYFGSSYEVLRARDGLDCNNPANQLFCKLQCQNDVGVCYASKCYCVYEPEPDKPKKSRTTTYVDSPEQDVLVRYSPGRRHHIAHFCPDLEKARKCIRKCMKEGKPAFCGKDHVCYCGHRYYPHQKKDELDPEKIKNGFYDLYMKYFGPDTLLLPPPPQKLTVEESPNTTDHVEETVENTIGPKELIEVQTEENKLSEEEDGGKGGDIGGENLNHEDNAHTETVEEDNQNVNNDNSQEEEKTENNGIDGDDSTVDGTGGTVTQDVVEETTVQPDPERRNLRRKQYMFSL